MNLEKFHKIWHVVQLIPSGQVATYGQIADLAGLPGRARLVGKSLQYVPEEGFRGASVPWHRVLRASGQISFPSASEQFFKQRSMLIAEGVILKGKTAPLKQYQWQPDLMEILFSLEQ